MAIAVSAWFDPTSERVVRSIWKRVADAGLDDSLHTGPYRPHITLGVWEELPVEFATERLTAIVAEFTPMQVTFQSVGVFAQPPAAFLTPTVSAELRLLHERVHQDLHDGVARSPISYYLPGNWNPHCTLAWNLSHESLPAVVDVALRAGPLPLPATIDRIGLINTPAEIEIASFPL